jgi:protein-tyrosine phosphatase
MAEALLRHQLAAFGPAVTVGSAGTIARDQPASPAAVTVMAERGIDLSAHRSRRLGIGLIQSADLVVGMAREHVRETSVLVPEAWRRSFTLKELVRRAADHRPRQAGESLEVWLDGVGAGRVRSEFLGDDPADDVADPIGLSVSDYRQIADELDLLTRQLAASGWPLANAGAP